ncbi:xanthine dehydrogenase family Fe-S subunit [Pseudonocardia acidicola]|uniref:2Fe-2S iron-sulfur cluster binding domain-containing protein n=1 Tax=Pseudonocardia acidicola TaxID=2724939 RepID=A0ABX1SBH9_9PSEU|nr:2Fe-2S iron-sulfur cluster-binding protein [Pseudonocardia acidicola]NMH97711.1 2Fe-2S iron-sulfur cluster binding domain-containing protein [Pseudonocardia acidicola]
MTQLSDRVGETRRSDAAARDDVKAPQRTVAPREKVAAGELVDIAMTVNGTDVTVSVPARMHLADVLREHLGLTGTHLGCEHGVCGMCTVLVDGDAARACLLFAVQCEGAEIVTVEGLGAPDDQHPLQQAFSAHHGLQCGFCTPGMLMSSYDLLANGPQGTKVDPADLPEEMSGVICRCTGYRGILDAVADVAAEHPEGLPGPRNCAARTLVGRGGGHSTATPGEEAAASAVAGPALPQEVRMPGGAPSATVEVTSALSAPVEKVWAVLDDFDQLARCLPGAELVEVLADDRYRGRAKIALGPVKLSFEGLAQVIERDPADHRMRVLAQGADTGGSATQADIRLRAEAAPGGGTVLKADAALFLSGRIAQFGRALAGDVSRRLFEQFGEAVDQTATTGTAPDVSAGPSPVKIAMGAALDAIKRGAARARVRIQEAIRTRRAR